MRPRRVGVVAKEHDERLAAAQERLAVWADTIGAELLVEPEGGFETDDQLDLMVTLGGDGTLLRGARQVADANVPILGVNLGRLGFLTSVAEPELGMALEHLDRGDFTLQRRAMLEGSVRGAREDPQFLAFNDFVIHKSGVARVTRLSLSVTTGDQPPDEIGSFVGDGVIVATPTGSTAYSLSAGGPIVVPSVECILVTPICPHSLAVRPLAIPTDAVLHIQSVDRSEDLVLTVDGQEVYRLAPDDVVEVGRSQRSIALVRLPGATFFKTLRRKLGWALDGSNHS